MKKKKTNVVIFTKNNARILVNPDAHPEGALVNPDLSAVKGEPPHFWKLSRAGKIVPMTRPEKLLRMAHIELNDADNSSVPSPGVNKGHFVVWLLLILSFLAGVSAGAIL